MRVKLPCISKDTCSSFADIVVLFINSQDVSDLQETLLQHLCTYSHAFVTALITGNDMAGAGAAAAATPIELPTRTVVQPFGMIRSEILQIFIAAVQMPGAAASDATTHLLEHSDLVDTLAWLFSHFSSNNNAQSLAARLLTALAQRAARDAEAPVAGIVRWAASVAREQPAYAAPLATIILAHELEDSLDPEDWAAIQAAEVAVANRGTWTNPVSPHSRAPRARSPTPVEGSPRWVVSWRLRLVRPGPCYPTDSCRALNSYRWLKDYSHLSF